MNVSMMPTPVNMTVTVVVPSWCRMESAGMEEQIFMSWREEQ
jgi:hypothetical protein